MLAVQGLPCRSLQLLLPSNANSRTRLPPRRAAASCGIHLHVPRLKSHEGDAQPAAESLRSFGGHQSLASRVLPNGLHALKEGKRSNSSKV
jgi:hypothetical protein